ncbi:MAG: hypothetical protein JNL05_05460 [Flavobacteriales bacterium]|nr:hypothetical protein [Flavobacteriales bacterium]
MRTPAMARRALGIALIVGIASPALAQNDEDALRYSWVQPGGTARSWGLGSAMGAVGADPSSASLNPAGFALYNTSEFSITPLLEVNSASTTHYGTTRDASNTRFAIGNFALVLAYPGKSTSEWKATHFGVSFDREATYHWDRNAYGSPVNSTMLQQFASDANGTPADVLYDTYPYGAGLAWDTYAIDPADPNDTLPSTYAPAIPFGSDVEQQRTNYGDGRSQTTSIFFAANWMDKVYLGASLGLVSIRYDRSLAHTERSLVDTLDLNDFVFSEELATRGGGVDLKVGAVVRVTDRLRMGLSYHSPRWMTLDDAYFTRMTTRFRTPDQQGRSSYTAESPSSTFSYNVNSPYSLLASAAYIAGKLGLVSVDYGYTDYSRMDLRGDPSIPNSYDFAAENEVIRTSYRGAHSVRVGTEWRAGNWYMRGGWGWWQDPYADGDARQGTGYKRYTVGGGYRNDHLSLDLAFNYGTRDGQYYLYAPQLVDATSERLTDTRALLTLAYRP